MADDEPGTKSAPASVKSSITVTSVQQFIAELRNRWSKRLLFRGEDTCDYPLRSKFGRWEARNPANNRALEAALVQAFKKNGAPYLEQTPENDWEWLALAQHFGLATRLLDWSENALVAAYFATRDSKPRCDRGFYLLDKDMLQKADESLSPFAIQETVVYRPKHVSARITSQLATFTAHPNPSEAFESPGLEKWAISAALVGELQTTIQSFGINEAYVFPGLEGTAANLNHWYLRQEKHKE